MQASEPRHAASEGGRRFAHEHQRCLTTNILNTAAKENLKRAGDVQTNSSSVSPQTGQTNRQGESKQKGKVTLILGVGDRGPRSDKMF